MKIYLAAPLFTAAERLFNSMLAMELRILDHKVWLPQDNEPRDAISAPAIFGADIAGLVWCEAVVACMDGPDPDSGTSWECGYAYAKGKPVIAFRTDLRSADDNGAAFNIMLAMSARAVILQPERRPVVTLARRIDAELPQ